jgi:hypothetical protein
VITSLRLLTLLSIAALVVVLSGCGGGGDDSASSVDQTGTVPKVARPKAPPIDPNVKNQINTISGDPQFQQSTAPKAKFSTPTSGEDESQAAYDYLAAVIQDADKVWSAWFKNNGLQEPYTGYDILQAGQEFTSKCTDAYGNQTTADTDFNNAFYCSEDQFTKDGVTYTGTVVLPLNTFLKMWGGDIFGQQSNFQGDFEAATIAAHEWGHSIQDNLAKQLPDLGAISSVSNNELLADCFSGVWAFSAYAQGLLDNGDVNEAVDALQTIGDYDTEAPDHHGTPDERATAWEIGYYGTQADPRGGVPLNCIKAYWK